MNSSRIKALQGSVTVEAAISLPVFICVILSIAFLTRIVVLHCIMQNAVDETANEIATYSYLYSVTFQDANDRLKGYLEDNKEPFSEHLDTVFEVYDALDKSKNEAGNLSESIGKGDTDSLIENIRKLETSIKDNKEDAVKLKEMMDQISGDPKKEMISIGCLMADGAFEDLKSNIIAVPLTKSLIRKYLSSDNLSADNKMKSLNVVGGFNGLDFSESTIFRDKKNIEIVVRYKVKPLLPINILPDVYLIQRATVRAWLDGDGSSKYEASEENQTVDSVWDMEDTKLRGKIIQKNEGRNLPELFPVLTKYEDGNSYVIRSIDLDAPSYSKTTNVEAKIKAFIKEYSEFQDGTYKNIGISMKSKTLIIVIPEGTINKIQNIIDKYKKLAAEKGISLVIKEGYGRRKSQEVQKSG